jgi:beta-N-acetylhexosaminidase
MDIPFLVTVDLEGCWNPFANFKNFTALTNIESEEEAEMVGAEEGVFLRELGFSLDFSPVVDLQDEIWGCRAFPGDKDNIVNLASAYIRGMEGEGITTTLKHYPGKTLVVRDPHKYIVSADISSDDVYPFNSLSGKNLAPSIMVSHIISSGVIDSEGKPAVVSKPTIDNLKQQYNGLIISDEINMLGLKNYYKNIDDLYVDVFASGNDLVLNFNEDPNEIYRMIQVVKSGVEQGKISEEQIDASVKKILTLKGFEVK